MEGETIRRPEAPAAEPYAARFGAAPAALWVAHPGHELHLHGWLEVARPSVCVLTDGSGRSGPSRIAHTEALVRAAGATPGPVFGRVTDRELYEALRARKPGPFLQLTEELASRVVAEEPAAVVVDALEGAILAHDALHLCALAAVEWAALGRRRPALLAFSVMSHPWRVAHAPGAALTVELGSEAWARKLAASHACDEIRLEVAEHRAAWGDAAYRLEVLRETEPFEAAAARLADATEAPAWERHGEALARSGVYPAAIRLREHLLPLAETLARGLDAEAP